MKVPLGATPLLHRQREKKLKREVRLASMTVIVILTLTIFTLLSLLLG